MLLTRRGFLAGIAATPFVNVTLGDMVAAKTRPTIVELAKRYPPKTKRGLVVFPHRGALWRSQLFHRTPYGYGEVLRDDPQYRGVIVGESLGGYRAGTIILSPDFWDDMYPPHLEKYAGYPKDVYESKLHEWFAVVLSCRAAYESTWIEYESPNRRKDWKRPGVSDVVIV